MDAYTPHGRCAKLRLNLCNHFIIVGIVTPKRFVVRVKYSGNYNQLHNTLAGFLRSTNDTLVARASPAT